MRSPWFLASALVAVVATAALTFDLGCGKSALSSFETKTTAYGDGARLVVVGDLQRTSLLEFWREQNDAERARLVAAVAELRPDLLVMTGDCVFDGGSDRHWKAFDALVAPLRTAGIPVAVAFGNHEYWSGRPQAEAHVFPRFPLNGRRHWFSLPFGPLLLVVLDSNRSELGDPDWLDQSRWYGQVLKTADGDPAVAGVLVLLHHPPYTNSTVTGDELEVQGTFVPQFLQARKTLALASGHVHSYERYQRGGKTFVVSGGGGGPRAALATGDARRHRDDLFDGGSIRSFHFTVYSVRADGVSAEVHGLARGATQWSVMDRFNLPFPPSPGT